MGELWEAVLRLLGRDGPMGSDATAEYVVECAEVPFDGGTMVLPRTSAATVRERITRCVDCRWYGPGNGECMYRPLSRHTVSRDEFCSHGEGRQ